MSTFIETDHPRNHPTGRTRFSEKANSAPEGGLGGTDMREWGSTGVDIGSRTPWGEADYAVQEAPGITRVATPGHGGTKLSAERNRAVHPALRERGGWYEEDCAEAIVAFTFPEETRVRKAIGYTVDMPLDEHIAHNDERVRNWFPDGWEAATGKALQPGESHERDSATWAAAHVGDFVVTSASTDSDDPEWVIVTAKRGDNTQRFRVPTAAYRAARETPELGQGGRFVIDTARHEQLPALAQPVRVPAKQYTGIATTGLTSAAQAKVDKDLRKRWLLDGGSIQTLAAIIDAGITGKGVGLENGKRSYYLSQKDYEGASSASVYAVSKATWDAVEAPDSRTARQRTRQDLELAEHARDKIVMAGAGIAERQRAQQKLAAAQAAYEEAMEASREPQS